LSFSYVRSKNASLRSSKSPFTSAWFSFPLFSRLS